jgi:cell wall-associated NlpC family hydrolase
MRPTFVWLAAGVALVTLTEKRTAASDVVDLAASLIGRPYVWGAEGPRSFDCSGLTQYVFGEFAVDLPRRAVSQSRVGSRIGRRLQRGDLVFFSTDTRKSLVTHVGIYEGNGRMIEANKSAGRVRRSDLDDEYWVERFMFARRVMTDLQGPEIARDRRDRNDDDTDPSRRKRAVRKAAVRILREAAGALFRRPRR